MTSNKRAKVREGIGGVFDALTSTPPMPEPVEKPAPTDESTNRLSAKASKSKERAVGKGKAKDLRERPAGYVERAGAPRRRITAYLSPETAKTLRIFCASEAVEMSIVIEAALKSYLEKR
ncbi:MAG: hypothetical protein K8H88_32335 [Sandaracinaceae bacterium]|nr:hypothetical protein [Sandaracinaceae bacterium]